MYNIFIKFRNTFINKYLKTNKYIYRKTFMNLIEFVLYVYLVKYF